MGTLKKIVLNLVAGANIVTIVLMLAVAYSDRIPPTSLPTLACAGMAFPFMLLANLAFVLIWIVVSWKRVWMPLLGFALAYVPITLYLPLNTPHSPSPESLSVVTYNVCMYGYNGKNSFGTIADYICRGKYDIVCLQEDVDSWRRNVFKTYEKQYPYNDTVNLGNRRNGYNSLGIHTRFPIIKAEKIESHSGSPGNGSAAFFLNIGGDTVIVVNNHLECTHFSNEERKRYKKMLKGEMVRDDMRAESKFILSKLAKAMADRAPQAEAVGRYIEAHRQYPIIICGDFNDTPISYSRRTVGKGLTDCFAAAGRGLGLTYNQRGFNFRIDHMMCSPHFTPEESHVDSNFGASDHYPLISHLKKSWNP